VGEGPVRALLLARPQQDRLNEGIKEVVAVVGERLEQLLNGCDEAALLGCDKDAGTSDHAQSEIRRDLPAGLFVHEDRRREPQGEANRYRRALVGRRLRPGLTVAALISLHANSSEVRTRSVFPT